jgi:hypothetical protein
LRQHVTRAGVVAGALAMTTTASAQAQDAPRLQAADRVAAGDAAKAGGRAPGAAGRAIALQHRAKATAPWRDLARTTVTARERFAFRTAVPRSGVLRAAVVPAGGTAAAAVGAHSNEQRIAVARAVRVRHAKRHVTFGRRAKVAGAVAPRTAGVRVRLQAYSDGRWRTIDRARTHARGRYRLTGEPRTTGRMGLRVRTAAGAGFAAGRGHAGRVRVYRYAHASWYGPGLYGNPLGCGGTLGYGTYGVAHKYLPCGTKVTFRHGGRSLTVRVIDRGPFIAGREYDLTEATARALGFSGHGPIRTTR